MATRTVVCPDCDAPLSPGRLSCSFCGALVASVASGVRSMRVPDDPAPAPTLESLPAPKPSRSRSRSTKASRNGAAADSADSSAPLESLVDEPQPLAAPPVEAAAPEPRPAVEPAPAAGPAAATPVVPAPEPSWPSAPPEPSWPSAPPEPTWPDRNSRGPLWAPTPPPAPPQTAERPAEPSWPTAAQPAPPTSRGPVEHAAPAPHPFATALAASSAGAPQSVAPPSSPSFSVATPPPPRNPAGAYLPPSAVLPPAEALPLPSAKRAAEAERGGLPSGGLGSIDLSVSPRAGSTAIAGGAGVAILGFLLPWADIVLGSATMGGYFDRWGLAGPGHAIVLVLVAALGGLALIADRLPRWARPRLAAIGVGCLLFGLAWPYIFGPFNASLGIFFVTVGAVLMLGGGLLDLVLTRHETPPATV